jgi:hypothetical protein
MEFHYVVKSTGFQQIKVSRWNRVLWKYTSYGASISLSGGLYYPQNSKLLQCDNSNSAQEWFQGLMSPCADDSAMLQAMYAHCKTDSPTVWCSNCRVHVTQDLFIIWFCPTVKNVCLGQWHWNPCSVVTQQSLRPAIHSGTQRKTSPQTKRAFFDQTPYLSCSLSHQNVLSKLNTRSVPFSMDPYTHNPQLYWNTLLK